MDVHSNKNEISILYAEDDADIRESVETILKRLYKNMIVAKDGQEAIDIYERLKKQHVKLDVVISDINMPNKTGIELLEHIRNDNKDLPFIFTTGYSDQDYLMNAIKKNVTDYFLKPINIGLLADKIDEVVALYRQKTIIHKQRDELSRYISAIDNVAIISKTDSKGIITFANDIFCKISKYDKSELYGKPHSLVRHPDVSSETYEKMWHCIKQGNSWQGKLKNRAKDGSSYFVNATIIPMFDDTGNNIVEYIGIRFLTTDDEVEKRSFKKKVMQNFQNMRKKHFEDADYIKNLELRLKDFENKNLLEEILENEKKKSSKLLFQVKFYENEMKALNEKNNKLVMLSKDKINEVNKQTVHYRSENNKLKQELNTTQINNKKNSDKIVLLETKIIELENQLNGKNHSLSKLKELLEFRERQIKNLRY